MERSAEWSDSDMGIFLSDGGAEGMVSPLDLASTALPFDSDGDVISVPPKEETLPLVAGVELPLPDAASSVPLFAVSSASMVITLAGGTSTRKFSEPPVLGWARKPFFTNLPSMYQPERA